MTNPKIPGSFQGRIDDQTYTQYPLFEQVAKAAGHKPCPKTPGLVGRGVVLTQAEKHLLGALVQSDGGKRGYVWALAPGRCAWLRVGDSWLLQREDDLVVLEPSPVTLLATSRESAGSGAA